MGVYVTGVPSVPQSDSSTDCKVEWGHYVEAQALIASHFRRVASDASGKGLSAQDQTQQDVRRASFAVLEDGHVLMSSTLFQMKNCHDIIASGNAETASEPFTELRCELDVLKQEIIRQLGHLDSDSAEVAAKVDFELLKRVLNRRLHPRLAHYLMTHLNQGALFQMEAPLRYYRCELMEQYDGDVPEKWAHQAQALFSLNLESRDEVTLQCRWLTVQQQQRQALASTRLKLVVKQDRVEVRGVDFQFENQGLSCYHDSTVQTKTVNRLSFSDVADNDNKFGPNTVAMADSINQLSRYADSLLRSKPAKAKALQEVVAVARDFLVCRINRESEAPVKVRLFQTLVRHQSVLKSHSNVVLRLLRGVCHWFTQLRFVRAAKPSLVNRPSLFNHRLATRSEALAAKVMTRTDAGLRVSLQAR